MNLKRLFIIALALTAAGAFALSDARVELVNTIWPTWFQSGLYVGTASTNPPSDTKNKITKTLGASIDYNFAASTILCLDSASVTVTGASKGDPCFVGVESSTLYTDGGSLVNGTFSCVVTAANTAVVRYCPAGTADNPGDAGFSLRVISNQ